MTAASAAPSASTLPQRVLHEALGTILLGTWLNALFFAAVLVQVWTYFTFFGPMRAQGESRPLHEEPRPRRPEPGWMRAMVVWLVTLDLGQTAAACAIAYEVRCTIFGREALAEDVLFRPQIMEDDVRLDFDTENLSHS